MLRRVLPQYLSRCVQSLALADATKAANARVARLVKCMVGGDLVFGKVKYSEDAAIAGRFARSCKRRLRFL